MKKINNVNGSFINRKFVKEFSEDEWVSKIENMYTIDDFDFGLCGASAAVREESISGDFIQHYLGPGCQGIDMQNNRINATSFTNTLIFAPDLPS